MNYYQDSDLSKFGNIAEWDKPLADKFFEYYNEVFKEGALTAREKSLIALAVAHVIQCPYDGKYSRRSGHKKRGYLSTRSNDDE